MRLVSSVLLVLVLAGTGLSQLAEQKLELRGFQGLNTAIGDLARPANVPSIAHNIDWSRNIGTMTKRYGYDSVGTVTGVDSMWIWSQPYSDGTRKLFIVGALTDSGYAAIWVTNDNSINVTSDSLTRIYDKWSVVRPPTFTMFEDKVYITNGAQSGIVYLRDLNDAREFPPRAPGEPRIIPLTVNGNLNGEYIYSCFVNAYSGDSTYVTYRYLYSAPIAVHNGKILLDGWDLPAYDSSFTSAGGFDSVKVGIKRTLSGVGEPTAGTRVYTLVTSAAKDSATFLTYSYTDNLADANLDDSAHTALVPTAYRGRDSLGVITRYVGAPGYKSATDGSGAAGSNIHAGWPSGVDTMAYSYAVSFMDTVTGVESRLSAPLSIFTDSGYDTIAAYTVSLPSHATRDSGLIYNLYRAPIIRFTHDTSFISSYDTDYVNIDEVWCCGTKCMSMDEWMAIGGEPDECYLVSPARIGEEITATWTNNVILDSTYTELYRLLTQIPSDSTTWKDTIPLYEVKSSYGVYPYYEGSGLPGPIDYVVPIGGRLLSAHKSQVFWTNPDNSASWGSLRNTYINKSDGDLITAMWPTRRAIRIFKNNSIYNFYAGEDDLYLSDWSSLEVAGYIGCVAPKSHAEGIGGHYYLSSMGVIRESEGADLDRTYNLEDVSAPLKNFRLLSNETKRGAVGFYHDRKYMMCIGDTTYVFDEISNGWATWGLTFQSATHYAVISAHGLVPADTMYFSNNNEIYRYGTTEYDNYRAGVDSTSILIYFKYGPLLLDEWYKSVTAVGLWCESSDTTMVVGANIYDEEGVADAAVSFTPLSQRYTNKNAGATYGKGFSIYGVGAAGSPPNNAAVKIDGLDIYYIIHQRVER